MHVRIERWAKIVANSSDDGMEHSTLQQRNDISKQAIKWTKIRELILYDELNKNVTLRRDLIHNKEI